MSDEVRIALIRKMDAAEIYSDAWTCPKCGRGDMNSEDAGEGYEACEALDRVQCDECAHACVLRDILFVKGDISTLLKALDEATNRTKPETFPRDWRKCPEFVACLEARQYIRIEPDESMTAYCEPGHYLYMYELWQDGKQPKSNGD